MDGCGTCDDNPDNNCCGGANNIQCNVGQRCVDDPSDDCDPSNGGVDCIGICEAQPQCPDGQIRDNNGVCCAQAELDCAFFCNGDATQDDSGCCTDAQRDCAGDCFGIANQDNCGVCDEDPNNDDTTSFRTVSAFGMALQYSMKIITAVQGTNSIVRVYAAVMPQPITMASAVPMLSAIAVDAVVMPPKMPESCVAAQRDCAGQCDRGHNR